ncbi:hypothetical protein AB6A40_005728 [Gnathostoma spinigerum]|uniref:RecA family profile 1 domain-containing protein n=1 Tax=Gnathostoma spinigerum TaxID=75299 RepID=A0ABD6EGA5_9BILA
MNPESDEEVEQETAFDLFLRFRTPWLFVKTGVERIDHLLGGGFLKSAITELVGGIAVGKTQLCFTTVCSVLLDSEDPSVEIVYLDTNGSFCCERLVQIIEERTKNSCQNSKIISSEEYTALLRRVHVARIYDDHDLSKALKQIMKLAESRKISLVIIDSVGNCLAETALTYLESGGERQERILNELHELALIANCAIVTVNHLVFWKKDPAPSLGHKWISAVDDRILMSNLPNSKCAQLIKSNHRQLGDEQVLYQIGRGGIIPFRSDEKTL